MATATSVQINTGDWDLSPFYSEKLGADYNADRQTHRQRLEQLQASAATADLAGLLNEWEQLLTDAEHMGSYLTCLRSADGRDQTVAAELASLGDDNSGLHKISVVLGDRLKKLSSKEWTALLARPETRDLEYYLERMRTSARWQMDAELENLAADLDVDGKSAWGRLYDQLAGRLEFDYQDSEGNTRREPMSMKVSLLEDPDAGVRRRVLEGSNQAWKGVEDVTAACLNAIAGTRLKLYERRGIPHFLEPALFDSGLQAGTLDAMMNAIASRYETARDFLRLKARIMGVPRLGWQDLSAPLPGMEAAPLDFVSGGARLVNETRAAYPDFANFCESSLAAKWVDWTPRDGKRPGGYCTGSTRLRQSRIFMTYHGAFGDLMTLAHEFGHAYHTHVMAEQRPLNTHYPMTLAETASTFAENLLLDQLLKSPELTAPQRLKLLDSRMEQAAAFTLNIPSRFLFEKRFYEERARGEVPLSRLHELMRQAQEECYGDSLDPQQLDSYFWASKLHFYITDISFYNFPYSFGYLFSLGVYARFQQEGAGFLKNYERLLADTGRASAEEVARRHLGVDLGQPDFWLASLDQVARNADQFHQLATQHYGLK